MRAQLYFAMRSISVNKAIIRGIAMVYGLFFPCIFGVPALTWLLAPQLRLPDFWPFASIALGIAAAWIWWSYRVPQWRLWALRHVDDVETLHQRAVQAGIEWPYGHLFERTEIKSRSHARHEASLQLRYYVPVVRHSIDTMDSNAGVDSLLQEIDIVLQLVTSDQTVSLQHLDRLEQRLQQYVQQSTHQTHGGSQAVFATIRYVLRKYRRASDRSPPSTTTS